MRFVRQISIQKAVVSDTLYFWNPAYNKCLDQSNSFNVTYYQ